MILTLELEFEGDLDQRKWELFHIYIKDRLQPKTIRSWRKNG